MAGDGVVWAWDDSDLQKVVADKIDRVQDMTPVMLSFSEYMVTRTDQRFKDEEDPAGNDWAELKPATVARKRRLGKIDRILQEDGFLRMVHPHADKDSAGVYSDRIQAAIHNRGGQAGPNRSVTIKKREFLGFNNEDIKEFQGTIIDWVVYGGQA